MLFRKNLSFNTFFLISGLITPDEQSEGYMGKDQDNQISEFKTETGRGK